MNQDQQILPTKELRSKLRAMRRSLSPSQQKAASTRLRKHINTSGLLLRAKHIALYISHDGEIDPQQLVPELRSRKKHCYLPVLHPLKPNQLAFCRINASTQFKKNRFGIPEPVFKHSIKLAPERLSLVLLPLVAFDQEGNRMGMGGGYYDRTFAFKRRDKQYHKQASPRLIGLAHELQKQPKLASQSWDIPLSSVITDGGIYLEGMKQSGK